MPNFTFNVWDSASHFGPARTYGLGSSKLKITKARIPTPTTAPVISNTINYREEMLKSLHEKKFFLNYINPALLVDFGCGDGSLIISLLSQYTSNSFMGYDISESMIETARSKHRNSRDANSHFRVNFTRNWDEIEENVKQHKHFGIKTGILLSSVLHEVLHYSTPEELAVFTKRVFSTGFDYIIIRDMMPSTALDMASAPEVVARIRAVCDEKGWAQRLASFEEIWGAIDNKKNMVHFLLKYRFEANWDREVKENYFPMYVENFMQSVPVDYDTIHFNRYTLPFAKEQVKTDFGIALDCFTHTNIILQRERFNGDTLNS